MLRLASVLAVVVVAHLAQGCGDSSSFRFANSGLVVTTGSLPLATRGQAYSTTLAAAGGRPVYSWSIVSGALPDGLALAANGTISGTPTTAGEVGRFRARVIDINDFAAERDLVLGVEKEVAVTTAATLPPATLGAPYSQRLQATGGSAPYTWEIQQGTTFPPGFNLNRLTGDVIAIPTQAGTFSLSVVVEDTQNEAGQATATKTFQVTVN